MWVSDSWVETNQKEVYYRMAWDLLKFLISVQKKVDYIYYRIHKTSVYMQLHVISTRYVPLCLVLIIKP